MNFKCIGYDIRYINSNFLSADICIWERDDEFYGRLIETLGFTENALQVLSLSKKDLIRLKDELVYRSDLCLVSISVLNDVYFKQLKNDKRLVEIYTDFTVIQSDYDICDIDGFFSFFDMQQQITKQMFDEMDWGEKLALIEVANQQIKEHSPFHLVKIEIVQFNL